MSVHCTSAMSPADLIPLGSSSCFATGTAIRTVRGEKAIQELVPGDQLYGAGGFLRRVRWLWRQKVDLRRYPEGEPLMVEIVKGGLGDGLPDRDLRLTPDHGLLIDQMLVSAGALVDGKNVRWVRKRASDTNLEVYQVETEAHDLVFANGVVAETLAEHQRRLSFDNFWTFVMDHPDLPAIARIGLPRVRSREIFLAKQRKQPVFRA